MASRGHNKKEEEEQGREGERGVRRQTLTSSTPRLNRPPRRFLQLQRHVMRPRQHRIPRPQCRTRAHDDSIAQTTQGLLDLMSWDSSSSWLSSGTEDYFLSASYFDEGIYADTQAGLTWGDGQGGNLSAYKTHTRDLLPFHGGFSFVWRNYEQTPQGCPNSWPPTTPQPPTQQEEAAARQSSNGVGGGGKVQFENDAAAAADEAIVARKRAVAGLGSGLKVAPLTLTSIVYYYAWPTA